MRIAMWSGPRNLSTAMMYSFASRGDCAVWDEPFYGAYLAASGVQHPMRDEILAASNTDADDIARACLAPPPENKPHFYQKHMTQHMRPEFPREWMRDMTNIFLIREPKRVIASFHEKHENPNMNDIGFQAQAELFDYVSQLQGHAPVVIDSYDIRRTPEAALTALCEAIGLPFRVKMLTWKAGGIPEDGVWAKHWYNAVHKSTGFAPPETAMPALPSQLQNLADSATPYYEAVAKYKLVID